MITRPLPPPDVLSLLATPGALTPAFAPSILNYTLNLPNSSADPGDTDTDTD